MNCARHFRRVVVAATVILIIAVVAILVIALPPFAAASAMDWQPGSEPGADLTMVGDLPVAAFTGDAATRGAAQARRCGKQAGRLLALMKWQPKLLFHRHGQRFRATLAAISADDRAEIAALATGAGLSINDLLAANALVDTQCSALVHDADHAQPLLVARNMDFFPARVLGPATMVSVVRGAGPHAYANIGWPGGIGVVSGMNDQGLVACILLNKHGPRLPGGEPLQLRVRALLANESDVEHAVQRFAAASVGSSHYVLLADSHTACIVWQEPDGLHRDNLTNGWLAASNGLRKDAQPQDDRGLCLRHLAESQPISTADESWMRQVLTASYMPTINTQAMLFVPTRRELQLARGTGFHPAAKQDYVRLPLAPVFDGAPISSLKIERLSAPVPLRHYTED